MSRDSAAIGVSDHAGWAVLVTVARDGTLLDRRRVELVGAGLPAMPHHHDAKKLPIDEGVALVEKVRASAERFAKLALDGVALVLPRHGLGLALREYQPLPATVAERLQDYRAQNVADWVMYRRALAGAAEARGWPVHFYDPKTVLRAASETLRIADIAAYFRDVRRSIGPPWDKDHKLAMAAAVVAANAR